jgi:plastocyanin
MKKTNMIIVIIVIIVIGLGIALFSLQTSNVSAPSEKMPVNTTPTETPATKTTNITVSIKNFSFSPSTIIIKPGTNVIWVNDDSAAHTIVSDSGNLLNSQPLSPGQSFDFTFTELGSINYYCSIHPSMKGTIIVEK